MGIDWDEERQTDVKLSSGTYTVVHGNPALNGLNIGHGKIKLHRTMPFIPLPEKCLSLTSPPVSKVMIENTEGHILMAKVERGFFKVLGLPGGYMNHSEEPAKGCIRNARRTWNYCRTRIDNQSSHNAHFSVTVFRS